LIIEIADRASTFAAFTRWIVLGYTANIGFFIDGFLGGCVIAVVA
jgi:hypothetical protein